MKAIFQKLFLCFVFVFLYACSSGSPEDPGRLILSIASQPTQGTSLEGLEGVILNVKQIEVILREDKDDPSTERRIQIPTEQRSINLLGLEENVSRLIGIYQIEPGFLMQMRFIGENAEIIFEQESATDTSPSVSLALDVPSGEQTGIKIIPEDEVPIEIKDQENYFWEIQFNPSAQIIVNRGQGYKMKPVLQAKLLEQKQFSPTVPNQILVSFKESVTREEIENLNTQIGATIVGSYAPLNLYLMEFTEATYEEVAQFYQAANDKVEEASPSVILSTSQTAVTPNDTNFRNQWALDNTGQTGGALDADIDAAEAWALDHGGVDVVIAVLDTGAQLDHPDLVNNIFINRGELPAGIVDADGDGFITFNDLNAPANRGAVADTNLNGLIDGEDLIAPAAAGGLADGIDNDFNGSEDDLVGINFANLASGGLPRNDPSDDSAGWCQSHGTAVSGVIGAEGNNAHAVSGINWRVRILPVKVCTSACSCPGINTRAGIQYALSMGAHVANLSLGATFLNNPNGQDALNSFAGFLNRIGSQGMLLVVSAGNDSADCDKGTVDCFMAETGVPHLIGIAATTDQDNLASSYSNYGDTTIPLAAPGSSILTLSRFSGTTFMDGTSFAAPQVSGVAGLVLSRNPGLMGNPLGIINRLEAGADSVGSLNDLVVGGRRLNALGAVR